MMTRIEAGEALAAVNRAAISHNLGFERELDRQEQLDALRRRAAGAPPPAPVKADPSDLAAMGIGVSNAGDLPTIGDLEGWLDQSPSNSAPVGGQEHG